MSAEQAVADSLQTRGDRSAQFVSFRRPARIARHEIVHGHTSPAFGLLSQDSMEPRPPAASATTVSQLMMPGDVNNLGHVFGGVLLSMVDRAAAVAAMRHAGRPCVTVSIDRVDFMEPILAGELVTCHARVNFVGRTSMEVGVRVHAENPLTRYERHTNTCYLTFVSIDDDHRPAPVPPLQPETGDDRRRIQDGQRRREVRRALARELGEDL